MKIILNYDDCYYWFCYKLMNFNNIEWNDNNKNIYNKMLKNEINGKSLLIIKKSDLFHIGFYKLIIRTKLFDYIKILRNKQIQTCL